MVLVRYRFASRRRDTGRGSREAEREGRWKTGSGILVSLIICADWGSAETSIGSGQVLSLPIPKRRDRRERARGTRSEYAITEGVGHHHSFDRRISVSCQFACLIINGLGSPPVSKYHYSKLIPPCDATLKLTLATKYADVRSFTPVY